MITKEQATRDMKRHRDRYVTNCFGQVADVKDWVFTCQERKAPAMRGRTPLGEKPLPSKPWQFVEIDLKVSLLETPAGKQYLPVICGAFSKYVPSTTEG